MNVNTLRNMLFSNHYNKQSIQNKRKASTYNRNTTQNRRDSIVRSYSGRNTYATETYTKNGTINNQGTTATTSINQSSQISSSSYNELKKTHITDIQCFYKNAMVHFGKAQEYNRNRTEQSLQDILKYNNIEIPEGTNLTFSVSSYDYYVSVSGTDDEALKTQIEQVLNYGDNGNTLYNHIYQSSIIYEDDVTQLEHTKSSGVAEGLTAQFVKDLTGYDLRDCTLKDGEFYAPDGTNIKEALIKAFEDTEGEYPKETLRINLQRLDRMVYRMGKNGGEMVFKDHCLSIDYKDGHLYDKNEKGYGPGQKEWLEKNIAKHGDEIVAKIIDGKFTMLNQQEEKTVEDISLENKIDWIYSDDKHLLTLEELENNVSEIDGVLTLLGIDKEDFKNLMSMLEKAKSDKEKRTIMAYFFLLREQGKGNSKVKDNDKTGKIDHDTAKRNLRSKFEDYIKKNDIDLENMSDEEKKKVSDYLDQLGMEWAELASANPHFRQYSPSNKTV